MSVLLAVVIYLAVGYASSRYVWDEDVLAVLVGPKNYCDQNLIPLFFLYFIGACATFVLWPLAAPAILIWRIFKKKGQGK